MREIEEERTRSRREPLSSATPVDVPFPFSPPRTTIPARQSSVDPILEAGRGLTPAPCGPQAGFLNFVTFKFKHSHLLRSPPPRCLCLLPMPILSLPSRGYVVPSLSYHPLLFCRSFITSLLSFHYPYAHVYPLPPRPSIFSRRRIRKHERAPTSR